MEIDNYEPKSPEHPLRAFFVGLLAAVSTVIVAVVGVALAAIAFAVAIVIGIFLLLYTLIVPTPK